MVLISSHYALHEKNSLSLMCQNSSKFECVSAGYRAVHCQLAFALFLQTQLPRLMQTCAFDPVFTVLDRSVLNEFQIKVSCSCYNLALC